MITAGSTATVTANANVSMVIQVTPTSLNPGTYGGLITVSPANGSSFTAFSISLNVTVGGGLVVAAPNGGTLAFTLPVGYPALAVPTNVLPFGEIYITDAQVTGSPTITINGPTNPIPGITVVPTTVAGATPMPAGGITFTGISCGGLATSCGLSPGTTEGIVPSFNTFGLTVGSTYSANIVFSGTSTGITAPFTVTVPVLLTIAPTPSIVGQNNLNPINGIGQPSGPLTGITLSAIVGQTTVCTGPSGTVTTTPAQVQANPTFFTSGGVLGNGSFTSSVSSGVNFITAPTNTNFSLNSGGTNFQFCVNPQLLGNSPGIYSGIVSLTVPGASNSPLVIPVVLLLNNTPGHLELSNIGVYRAAGGLGAFALDLNQTTYNYAASTTLTDFFGLAGDQPVAGDWLGTGVVSIGVFRNGAWYFDLNNDGAFEAGEGPFYYGLPGDKAIVGDWTGSGSTKVGVFRCPTAGVCTWYLSTATQTAATLVANANLYSAATTLQYNYGLPGDQPVANNWNNGSADEIGVFRCPTTGVCTWLVNTAGDGTTATTLNPAGFGLAGDIAVVGDWNDNSQRKRIGVFRTSTGTGVWILDVNGSNTFAPNDIQAFFGLPGDAPVVGKWTQ
jgi:hypothetical protein